MLHEEKEQQIHNQEEESNLEVETPEQEQPDNGVQAEVTIWKDQCKRISAEFENFKKRTQRDQARWSEVTKENVLKDLLPFVDDFERALSQESSEHAGITMLHQSLLKLLEKNNIKPMVDYQNFDPEFHEAVMQVDSSEHESGYIVEVFRKGFMIQDRVLRPAQVSVAK
tara:strand:+ start:4342 stop:4848 length:507 start_codon:yes stop_codon:yes gene_type:complete